VWGAATRTASRARCAAALYRVLVALAFACDHDDAGEGYSRVRLRARGRFGVEQGKLFQARCLGGLRGFDLVG